MVQVYTALTTRQRAPKPKPEMPVTLAGRPDFDRIDAALMEVIHSACRCDEPCPSNRALWAAVEPLVSIPYEMISRRLKRLSNLGVLVIEADSHRNKRRFIVPGVGQTAYTFTYRRTAQRDVTTG